MNYKGKTNPDGMYFCISLPLWLFLVGNSIVKGTYIMCLDKIESRRIPVRRSVMNYCCHRGSKVDTGGNTGC